MRRVLLWLCMLLMLLMPSLAMAELGFAEVKENRVNFRKTPGGDLIDRLEKGKSVFVFEEEQRGGVTWCHVTTVVMKNTCTGWIRGDMLRYISEEFHDVESVRAGSNYVTGLRADGTVAIMGNDMPHMPCVETVRSWRNIRDVSSWLCEVYALDHQGVLHAVGRGRGKDGMRCDSSPYTALSGHHIPALLSDGVWITTAYPDAVMRTDRLHVQYVSGEAGPLYVALDAEGKLLVFENVRFDLELSDLRAQTQSERYTACDAYWNNLILLREDGTVFGYSVNDTLDVKPLSAWHDMVQVTAGIDFFLGLKADGTVVYAGADDAHRRQVEAWRDVAQISGGNGYSIALKTSGEVVMAGCYLAYDR